MLLTDGIRFYSNILDRVKHEIKFLPLDERRSTSFSHMAQRLDK